MDALPALHDIPPGRLRAFLCHDPLDTLRHLRDAPDTPAARVLVVSWSTLPVVARRIEDMLAALADAAAACGPAERDQPPDDVPVPWFRAASRRVDRQRDFELMLSGYRCLRLAHDEVMENVLKAIDKIRAAVRWRNTGSSS